MLIRREQLATLEWAALRQFEDEMVLHLRAFHPMRASAAGEGGLRRMIRAGIARAAGYGFTLRGPVRFYLELMMLFGYSFDTDPLMPWASRVLRAGGMDELRRADHLHVVAMDFHRAVVGSDGEFEEQAIRRLHQQPLAIWLSGDLSEAGVEAKLRAVYPEKCAAGGSVAVHTVVVASRRRTKDHAVPESTGGLVFALLSVVLGHGYVNDPVYPWVAENLQQTAAEAGERRVEKLATRAMALLSAVLAEHERG